MGGDAHHGAVPAERRGVCGGGGYYWHSKSTEENTKTYYQRSVHRICEGGYIPAIYNIVDGGENNTMYTAATMR